MQKRPIARIQWSSIHLEEDLTFAFCACTRCGMWKKEVQVCNNNDNDDVIIILIEIYIECNSRCATTVKVCAHLCTEIAWRTKTIYQWQKWKQNTQDRNNAAAAAVALFPQYVFIPVFHSRTTPSSPSFDGIKSRESIRFIAHLCDTQSALLQEPWTTIDQIQISVKQQQTTMTATTTTTTTRK